MNLRVATFLGSRLEYRNMFRITSTFSDIAGKIEAIAAVETMGAANIPGQVIVCPPIKYTLATLFE